MGKGARTELTLHTQIAKYISSEDSSYQSYTFHVSNTPDGVGLENILYASSDGGKSYRIYLLEYPYTEEKMINSFGLIGPFDFKGEHITYYPLNEEAKTNSVDCIMQIMTQCGEGNHNGGYYPDGSPCPAHEAHSSYLDCSISSSGGPSGGATGTYIPFNPSPFNGGGTGTGGAGNPSPGTEATSPIYLPMKSVIRKLAPYEDEAEEDHIKQCLSNNSMLTIPLEMFLGENPTPEQEAFGKETIKAKCENSDAEVEFEDRIINELVGKEKCLDEHLKESGNNFVQDLLANFEGDDSEFGIDIKSKDQVFYTDENGNTIEVNGKTRYTSTSNIIKIEISTSKAQNNRALQVVGTLLHEYIHADIFRKLNTQPPSNDDLIFRNTYNSFEDNNFEPTPAHETMASLYVNSMKEALKSYHMTVMTGDYNYLSNNGQLDLDNFYEALAWQGLKNHNVDSWQNMPQNQKDEIDQAYQQYIFATTHNCPN